MILAMQGLITRPVIRQPLTELVNSNITLPVEGILI
jgi:hypothetical protein